MIKFYIHKVNALFTICSCILVMNNIISQEYLPLPETNGKWINTYSILEWEPYPHVVVYDFVEYCTNGADTTINDLSYFIVDTCGGGYKGALRNDNGKVWFVPNNSQDEFLLYDFTVQSGDTIFNVYIESYWGDYAVYDLLVGPNAVDSILINGMYRKTIYIEVAYWIEGIGNDQGLFLEPYGNISNYFLDLYCMSVDDTTLYPEFSTEACEYPVGIKEKDHSIPIVYPNPAHDYVQFHFGNFLPSGRINGAIIITNSFGQTTAQLTIANEYTIWDCRNIPSGIYYYQARFESHVNCGKLIIAK